LSDSIRRRLIVYAKRPLPGRAKTRLGRAVGMEQAAGVYARLLYGYLLDVVGANWQDVEIELSVADAADVAFFTDAFPEIQVVHQVGASLGERMMRSFVDAFDQGIDAVVLTGSDIPGLNSTHIEDALAVLRDHDVALGPATDGGYYLIGMCAPGADLFSDIAWSTPDVLAQTASRAQALGLPLGHVATLSDIDYEPEYRAWRRAMTQRLETLSHRPRPDCKDQRQQIIWRSEPRLGGGAR